MLICVIVVDIDECSGSNSAVHDCDDGSDNAPGSDNEETQAMCRNLPGSFECYCPDGWTYDEQTGVCEGNQ